MYTTNLWIEFYTYCKLTSFVVSSTFKSTDFLVITRKYVHFAFYKRKNSSSSMLSFKIETRSCKAKLYVTDHFRNQNSLNVDVMKFRWFLDIIFSNHKVTDFEINSYNSFYYAQPIDFKRCEDSRYTNPNVSLILISVGQNNFKNTS